MKSRNRSLGLMVAVLCLAILACNISPAATPTIVFPTPNLTMTAFFAPTNTPGVILPTDTPVVITIVPTTAVPPTDTEEPVIEEEPTKTKVKTAVPPSERSGTTTEALYVSTPPKIDGGWGDWSATAYPAKSVVFGKSNWSDSDDLEGSYKVEWDNQYLYVAVKVIDDKFVQNSTGDMIYKGDCIELLLDVNLQGDFFSTDLSNDDYQIGVTPGKGEIGKKLEAFLWFPRGKTGGRDDIQMDAIKADNNVYRVEFAIPWSVFGVSPEAGAHFGFAVSVSDNDNPNKNEQQTMVSSAPNRNLADPTTWGDMVLVK